MAEINPSSALALAQNLENTLRINTDIEAIGRAFRPNLRMFPDTVCYYNQKSHLIHIGALMPLEYYGIDNDTELYVAALMYLWHHEMGHYLYTSQDPWVWGVEHGCRRIIEGISNMVEGTTRRFRNEREYEDYVRRVLPNLGVFLDYDQLHLLCNAVVNIMEDGRIERNVALQYKSFEKYRRCFRGMEWDFVRCPDIPYSDLSAEAAFKIVWHQFHSLSVVQLYEKGFFMKYSSSPEVP